MLILASFTVRPLINTIGTGTSPIEDALYSKPSSPGVETDFSKAAPSSQPAAASKPEDAQSAPSARPLSLARLRDIDPSSYDKQKTAENPERQKQPRAPIRYKVQEGETISGIAERFGVTIDSILGSNSLHDPDSLQIGDDLLIPPITGLLHRVTDGDNLYDLAAMYGVTPESIAEFNALPDPNTLQLDDLLVIPGGKIQPTRASGTGRGGRSTTAAAAASGSFRWPAGGAITQYFGENGHSGLDIAGRYGSPIYAADSGVVVAALKLSYGYGWYLVVDHENGNKTLYGHLSAFFADYGERVTKGQTIGAMGSTGLSTGPHLHFELFINGARVNPLKYLP